MNVDHELVELLYSHWHEVPGTEIMDMVTDTFIIYKVLRNNTEAIVRFNAPLNMKAYVTAAMLLSGCRDDFQAPVILVIPGKWRQRKALDYAQQLEKIMIDLGIIRNEIVPVISGDKDQYLCARRFAEYRQSVSKDKTSLSKLIKFGAPDVIDLDLFAAIDRQVIKRICVRECKSNCYYRQNCSYVQRIKDLETGCYPVQICSPYLFTKRIYDFYMNDRVFRFPDHSIALVTDLSSINSTSRSFMRRYITRKHISQMVSALLTVSVGDKAHHSLLHDVCHKLEKASKAFFESVESHPDSVLTRRRLKKMLGHLRSLEKMFSGEMERKGEIRRRLNDMLGILQEISDMPSGFTIIPSRKGLEIFVSDQRRMQIMIAAMKAAPSHVIIAVNSS